jgi:hypothetical protein
MGLSAFVDGVNCMLFEDYVRWMAFWLEEDC